MRVVSILATDPGIARERAQLVLEMIALPVVFGLLVLLASLRDRVVGVPTELTEPPEDLHPVDLAILWSAYRKHVSPRTAYRAEILHLARIQAIRLDPIGTVSEPEDFRLTLWRPVAGQVDRDFIHFMFPEHRSSSVITLHELRLASGGRDRLSRWWSDAYSRVGEPVQRMWLDQRAELWAAFVLGVWAPPAGPRCPDSSLPTGGGLGLCNDPHRLGLLVRSGVGTPGQAE